MTKWECRKCPDLHWVRPHGPFSNKPPVRPSRCRAAGFA